MTSTLDLYPTYTKVVSRRTESDQAARLVREAYHKFWSDVYDNAAAAFRHMDAAQLTAEQRFAIAVLGGAKFQSVLNDEGKPKFQTEPCSVYVCNGRWEVAIRAPVDCHR